MRIHLQNLYRQALYSSSDDLHLDVPRFLDVLFDEAIATPESHLCLRHAPCCARAIESSTMLGRQTAGKLPFSRLKRLSFLRLHTSFTTNTVRARGLLERVGDLARGMHDALSAAAPAEGRLHEDWKLRVLHERDRLLGLGHQPGPLAHRHLPLMIQMASARYTAMVM